MNKIINTIEKESLIAIMRGVPDDKCLKVAKAIIDGGVKILEVAFNPSDPDTIQKTSKTEYLKEHSLWLLLNIRHPCAWRHPCHFLFFSYFLRNFASQYYIIFQQKVKKKFEKS